MTCGKEIHLFDSGVSREERRVYVAGLRSCMYFYMTVERMTSKNVQCMDDIMDI